MAQNDPYVGRPRCRIMARSVFWCWAGSCRATRAARTKPKPKPCLETQAAKNESLLPPSKHFLTAMGCSQIIVRHLLFSGAKRKWGPNCWNYPCFMFGCLGYPVGLDMRLLACTLPLIIIPQNGIPGRSWDLVTTQIWGCNPTYTWATLNREVRGLQVGLHPSHKFFCLNDEHPKSFGGSCVQGLGFRDTSVVRVLVDTRIGTAQSGYQLWTLVPTVGIMCSRADRCYKYIYIYINSRALCRYDFHTWIHRDDI